MTENDVQIRFGPGGYCRAIHWATDDWPAMSVELTRVVDRLASAGVGACYELVAPVDGGGVLELDLGRGGRALWVTGGGELSMAEALVAVAAGYRALDDSAFVELVAELTAPWRREVLSVAHRLLTDVAGMDNATAQRWLTRKRTALGGVSARHALLSPSAGGAAAPDVMSLVLDLAYNRTESAEAATSALREILAEELNTPWPIQID